MEMCSLQGAILSYIHHLIWFLWRCHEEGVALWRVGFCTSPNVLKEEHVARAWSLGWSKHNAESTPYSFNCVVKWLQPTGSQSWSCNRHYFNWFQKLARLPFVSVPSFRPPFLLPLTYLWTIASVSCPHILLFSLCLSQDCFQSDFLSFSVFLLPRETQDFCLIQLYMIWFWNLKKVRAFSRSSETKKYT